MSVNRFREELRELMKGTTEGPTVPRLFIKGRHIGGAKFVLQLHEEGKLVGLLEGLPIAQFNGCMCDGCGGMRFLPCFQCNGSRKIVVALSGECKKGAVKGRTLICTDCNENGLVLCPICS
jgi:glutaredoxin domain-containing cysteine-rich protein 1